MNWYIGQEIICVKSHSMGCVKEGQTFVIKSLKQGECKCCDVLVDVGIIGNSKYIGEIVTCKLCYGKYLKANCTWWLNPCLFVPLEYDKQALEELIKLTQPQEQNVMHLCARFNGA